MRLIVRSHNVVSFALIENPHEGRYDEFPNEVFPNEEFPIHFFPNVFFPE